MGLTASVEEKCRRVWGETFLQCDGEEGRKLVERGEGKGWSKSWQVIGGSGWRA